MNHVLSGDHVPHVGELVVGYRHGKRPQFLVQLFDHVAELPDQLGALLAREHVLLGASRHHNLQCPEGVDELHDGLYVDVAHDQRSTYALRVVLCGLAEVIDVTQGYHGLYVHG